MDRYVARANIDHYLGILNDGSLAPERRAMITKLLVAEEDSLSHDLEQLQFAEIRAAKGRDRLNHLRRTLDRIRPTERAHAEQLVKTVEEIQHLLDDFCHHLRAKVNSRGL